MSTAQRGPRAAAETERARHIATVEAVGFSTTAATMLLGLVAGAEAHEPAAQPEDRVPPAHQPTPATPLHVPAPPPHAESSASNRTDGPPSAHATPVVEEASPILPPAPQAAPDLHAHALGSTAASAPAAPSIIEPHAAALTDHVGLHAPAAIDPSPIEPAIEAHQITPPSPTLLDGTLASLSQIGETLNATVQQVTTTLTNDIAHVTAGLSAMTSTLSSSLSALTAEAQHLAAPAETLAQHVVSDPLPHLDVAGAVPLPFVQLPPLQLGFLGQPTADGHDVHDGAFSALGAHHF
jgi:hypothetical protein